jgi:hypothetical protein
MTSNTSTDSWRVKITGLSPNVTASDLSDQFDVKPHLISIPKSQTDSSKWYALIDGFESAEQAVVFASEWNEAFIRGRIGIICEIDKAADTSTIRESSKMSINSNDKRSDFTHSNRSPYDYDSNDDDDISEHRNRK